MKGHGQPGPDQAGLEKLPKAKLIAMILEQREDTRSRLEEKDQQIAQLSEQLAKWHADGELDCEYVAVEGENSAQNIICGASMAGSRAFTATSSYGLVYMYDAMFNTAGYRAPVVMVNVNREPPGIHAV